MTWGEDEAAKLTLVGKGVCFDTGGLDLKISAVENAIGPGSVRPIDVVRARNGLAVEIANTDAEGRLILADALAEAAMEAPMLILDFATLTSAAMVALRPDIAAMFSNDDAVSAQLLNATRKAEDPIHRLPLWQPYAQDLAGKTGDITNVADLNLGSTTFAGAIYAALFLERFVGKESPWVHFGRATWNFRSRPGRPEGGEMKALMGVFDYLLGRFADAEKWAPCLVPACLFPSSPVAPIGRVPIANRSVPERRQGGDSPFIRWTWQPTAGSARSQGVPEPRKNC